MVAITCPFCRALANFSRVCTENAIPPWFSNFDVANSIAVVRCDNEACRMPIAATFHNDVLQDYWPKDVAGKDFPDVPDHISAAASEAHACLSIGAHRGAVALARAVVGATAKDHRVTNGTLWEKIDALHTSGIISKPMKDAAHEVRLAGNEVAHGDLVEEPLSRGEAEEVLGLMDAMLTRIYQEPAQVARVRERRASRLAKSDTAS